MVFQAEQLGFTAEVTITNFDVRSDISKAPIGLTQLFVSFDYSISNTTPGRQAQLVLPFVVRVPATCGEWGMSSLGGSGCDAYVWYYTTALMTPGGLDSGSFDGATERPGDGYHTATLVPEGLSPSDYQFGLAKNCSETCWYNAVGEPVVQ